VKHSRKYLKSADAAKKIGVATGTLANWRWKKVGPPYYVVGGMVRYADDELDGYVTAGRQTTADDPGADAARTFAFNADEPAHVLVAKNAAEARPTGAAAEPGDDSDLSARRATVAGRATGRARDRRAAVRSPPNASTGKAEEAQPRRMVLS
jgi:hypothetical protein